MAEYQVGRRPPDLSLSVSDPALDCVHSVEWFALFFAPKVPRQAGDALLTVPHL